MGRETVFGWKVLLFPNLSKGNNLCWHLKLNIINFNYYLTIEYSHGRRKWWNLVKLIPGTFLQSRVNFLQFWEIIGFLWGERNACIRIFFKHLTVEGRFNDIPGKFELFPGLNIALTDGWFLLKIRDIILYLYSTTPWHLSQIQWWNIDDSGYTTVHIALNLIGNHYE